MRCVAPEALLAYLEHRADDEARRAVEEHLDGCTTCRETVVALVSLAAVEEGVEPEPVGEIGPGSRILRYEVESLIGRGGMGAVHAAFDPELDRSVALKILDTGSIERSVATRCLAEARAMAQVSHPNVITVFDAGVHEGAVFIAMERFRGTTLRAWMSVERGWSEVVEVMTAAGRGLAAAHAAGIVHRDFKPENVLVARDGARVCVTDFGLAVPERTEDTEDTETSSHEGTPVLAGTLAYMAPEQLLSSRATLASDQFAFCVTAFEALFGRRPFVGTTRAELLESMSRPIEPPTGGVPRWLVDALTTGLAFDPAQRHPAMDVLLARLGRRRHRRSLWILGSGTVAACTAVGAAMVDFSAQGCDPEPWLGEVWTASRREHIEAAFLATGSTHAESSWARARAALDEHVGALKSAYVVSCESTPTDEAGADARLHCLDRARARLQAVVQSFETADREVVRHAIRAARSLPDPGTCASPPEIDPPGEDDREEVERIRGEIEAAQALLAAGRRADAASLLDALIVQARALGYAPVLAEALATQGSVLEQLDAQRAQTVLEEALHIAESSGMDTLTAKVRVALVFVVGTELGRPHEAQRWIRAAEAAIARAKEPPELTAALDYHVAVLLVDGGRSSDGEARASAGLERLATAEGDHAALERRLLQARGTARLDARRFDEGLADVEAALRNAEADLGAAHPEVDHHRFIHARALAQSGAFERALETLEQVLAYRIAEDGEGAPSVAAAHSALALVLGEMGRDVAAIEHHRACVETWSAREPSPKPSAGHCMLNLANALGKVGRCEEAVHWYSRARSELSRTAGARSSWVGTAWMGTGHCAYEAGDLGTAADAYERSLEILEAYERPAVTGHVRLSLARVHHRRGEHTRARQRAEEARSTLVALGDTELLGDVEAFLAELDAR